MEQEEQKHLDAAALERLLATDRTPDQNDQLFHVLDLCPACREVGGWLLELHQANALPPVFGPIDAALARSRAEAPQLWAELALLDPEERLARLHTDRRFVSWGLCELLVRESRQAAPAAASVALRLAGAALANALRVQGELSGAERGFEMSDSWWEAGIVGSEDALGYEPVLLVLKAPLRTAQRRFPEALKLFDDAVALFLQGQPQHRDPHLAGRALISKAFLLIEMGASTPAIQALKKANGLIDPEREPRLLLCVRHNLADNLSKAGLFHEAAALLPDLKELAATHGCAKDRLRLDWVEGRAAAGLGDHERARRLLTKVRQTFLEEGNAFDAALASLDLSISYLAEGKTAEVRELTDEMVSVFRNLDVAREPMAALLLFQEAARQETATAELAREVAASLTRARGSCLE